MTASDEHLYDAYLDACLAGDPEPPADVFRRHPGLDTDARRRIEQLYATTRARDGATTGTNGSEGAAAPTAPDGELPAEQLGEFRLLRPLGAGGMGMVYLAEQPSLGRRVALKVIHPDLRRSKTAVERFRREARAIARLRHPNVVDVHATGEDEGLLYIAMDLVPGRSLSDVLARVRRGDEPLDVRQVVAWLRDIAQALHAAHEAGIIHRDVKPSNIRITPEGRALLLDFGIARDVELGGDLTQTFAGSPLYAAPEQITGAAIDPRADVYGLGVTLYECLAGRVPFAGGPLDQIVRRVLDEEPLSPRLLNPSVSRDLDVVCRKALEKAPDDRYASAAALADDLDRVLESRPIRARPPTLRSRARKWARRHPVRATASLSAAAAAVILVGLLVVQGIAEERRRREEARQAVRSARARLIEYREARKKTQSLDQEIGRLQDEMTYKHLPRRAMRTLDQAEGAMLRARLEREAMFYAVLDELRRAERLDPGVEGVDGVQGELYVEKWVDASAARDLAAASFYAQRLRKFRAEGLIPETVSEPWRPQITSDPPGADVYLFRSEELSDLRSGAEPRMVVVPEGGTNDVAPGAWALRVVRGAGDIARDTHVLSLAGHPVRDCHLVAEDGDVLKRFDRLMAIDGVGIEDLEPDELLEPAKDLSERRFVFDRGGTRVEIAGTSLRALGVVLITPEQAAHAGQVRARVWRDGTIDDVTLPRGLVVRTTAAPVLAAPACLVGRTPLEIERPPGSYLFVFRKRGFESVRYATVSHGAAIHVRLPPAGEGPAGFVYVPAYPRRSDFWIMEREVTCREYLAFLNDSETLKAVDRSEQLRFVPRGPETHLGAGDWPRGKDGRYALAEDWQLDWPIVGVSYHDARAYAEWRARADTARSGVYALPTMSDWYAACVGDSARTYVFGNSFRPKWMCSCFGRRRAIPRPVRSFPIDESLHGVYDTAGNAFEWLDTWYDEARGLRHLVSGSWGRGDPQLFHVTGGMGFTEHFANGETGFRLVWRPKAGK